MKTLEQLRDEVDRADDAIADALAARFAATDEIGRVKHAHGDAVVVPEREHEIGSIHFAITIKVGISEDEGERIPTHDVVGNCLDIVSIHNTIAVGIAKD